MKNGKRILGIVIVLLIFVIIFLIIHYKLNSKDKEHECKEIKIGAILPLTGPGALFAQYIKEGLELKLEEINLSSEEKFSIIYGDSKNNPREALSVFKKMQFEKGLNIVIVALSSVAKALAPLAEKNKVTQIYIAVAIPNITDGKFRFRVYPNADGMAGVMANFCAKKLKAKKAGIIYINDDFGRASLNSFRKNFESLGGDIVLSESYNISETNFRSQLLKFKKSNLDVIYLNGYGISYGIIVRQLKELGINTQLTADMTMGLPNTLNQVNDAAEGVYFVDGKMSSEFIRKFKKKYNKEPSSYAGYAYDSLSILYTIFNKYGSLNPSILSRGFHEIKNFNGVMGKITIKKNGDSSLEFVVKKIENGHIKEVN